jgi:hypothetical protein
MITKRDQDVINFIEEFHIATSGQISRLFFSGKYRYCMKRLQYMRDSGFIKPAKSTIDNCRAYYINKKSLLQQIHHDLIRAELYTAIRSRYDLLIWENEATIEHIRPDALCYIKHSGIVFPLIIEVHLNNKFDFDKYKNIDFRTLFGLMPRVIICTDREVKLPVSAVKFKVVGLDMSGLDTLLK